MSDDGKKTLEKIRESALAEFLEKGYLTASLRNIVRTAGVTTGAFYGYYSSKEQLFDALVGSSYEDFTDRFREALDTYSGFSTEKKSEGFFDYLLECLETMTDFVYEHRDAFRLLLLSAEGTRYGDMIHDLAEMGTTAVQVFREALAETGRKANEVEPTLEHMLMSGLFSAFFQLVIHDVPQDRAPRYVRELSMFYAAGWRELMGV